MVPADALFSSQLAPPARMFPAEPLFSSQQLAPPVLVPGMQCCCQCGLLWPFAAQCHDLRRDHEAAKSRCLEAIRFEQMLLRRDQEAAKSSSLVLLVLPPLECGRHCLGKIVLDLRRDHEEAKSRCDNLLAAPTAAVTGVCCVHGLRPVQEAEKPGCLEAVRSLLLQPMARMSAHQPPRLL